MAKIASKTEMSKKAWKGKMVTMSKMPRIAKMAWEPKTERQY